MIVALAGRRIDAENATYKRFPLSAVAAVKEKLKDHFEKNNVAHLVSSGACGADVLAQEVASELNIRRTIVLPFDVDYFRNTSVTDCPGDWGYRYDQLIQNPWNNLIILKYDHNDPAVYQNTNIELLETAEKLRSHYGKCGVTVLLLWEGQPKDSDDLTLALKIEAQRRALIINEISTAN